MPDDNEFLQAAEDIFASQQDEPVVDEPVVEVDEAVSNEPVEDEVVEPVTEPVSETDPETDPELLPTTININGVELPIEEAQNLLQLQELIASDPNFQQHLYKYFTPDAPVSPAPATQAPGTQPPVPDTPALPWTPPDAEYLEHPVVKSLYEINLKQWEYIQNLKETVDTFNQAHAETQRKELEATVATVADNFKSEYQLNDTELSTLRQEAAKLGVVDSLMREGMAFSDAAKRALEMAYWATPEFRTRQLTESLEEQKVAKAKKAKAASISGSSGSAPRTTPKPQTKTEIRDAMIADLAEKF